MANTLDDYAEIFKQTVANMDLEQAVPSIGETKPRWHLGRIGLECFMTIISSERFELMKALRKHGPISVMGLARTLKRGRRSVDADILILLQSGLIDRTESGLFEVTWDQVTAKLDLLAA